MPKILFVCQFNISATLSIGVEAMASTPMPAPLFRCGHGLHTYAPIVQVWPWPPHLCLPHSSGVSMASTPMPAPLFGCGHGLHTYACPIVWRIHGLHTYACPIVWVCPWPPHQSYACRIVQVWPWPHPNKPVSHSSTTLATRS